jgi:rSAM/selenodomain-associated transferase 1
LAAGVTATVAAELYREFLFCLTARLGKFEGRRVLACWPEERKSEFESAFGKSWTIEVQSSGSLGQRMADYFQSAFAAGADRVLLIGSDSPTLTLADVEVALKGLDQNQVVLGPSEDGGYYLIGAHHKMPDLFTDMPWSTPELWPVTVDRLESLNTRWRELDSCFDVDDLDDVRRLRKELRGAAFQATEWDGLRNSVERVLGIEI